MDKLIFNKIYSFVLRNDSHRKQNLINAIFICKKIYELPVIQAYISVYKASFVLSKWLKSREYDNLPKFDLDGEIYSINDRNNNYYFDLSIKNFNELLLRESTFSAISFRFIITHPMIEIQEIFEKYLIPVIYLSSKDLNKMWSESQDIPSSIPIKKIYWTEKCCIVCHTMCRYYINGYSYCGKHFTETLGLQI